MKRDEFISKWTEYCKKTDNEELSIGEDMGVNTKLTIDEDDFCWIRYSYSFKRIKTTVSINNVTEFRLADWDSNMFYVICSDYSGFEVGENEIYYCIDGRPSGCGTAEEHFERFPDGIKK